MAERVRDLRILIAATTVWAVVMLAHPSHAHTPPLLWRFTLSDLVHGTALMVKPVLLYAAWKFAAMLDLRRALVGLGLASYALALVAMLGAAVVSTYLTPDVTMVLAGSAHGGGGNTAHGMTAAAVVPFARFSWMINQAFAQFYVTLASLAIVLWSLSWRRNPLPDRAIAVLGISIGVGISLWQLSGSFRPNPASMMLVAAGQSLWIAAAALRLLTSSSSSETSNA